MLKRLTAALVTSLFMSQALIAPAHAGLFDFKLGGDKVVASLAKGEEIIYTGTEKNGFMSVQGNDGEGWVEKILIKK